MSIQVCSILVMDSSTQPSSTSTALFKYARECIERKYMHISIQKLLISKYSCTSDLRVRVLRVSSMSTVLKNW